MRTYLPEVIKPGHRLGRIIDHDPRSLAYTLPESSGAASVTWTRWAPILDQGQLGSCTGNAAAGALSSGPNWGPLSLKLVVDEDLAVSIYNQAEILDGGVGLPSEDQGSSGLSVAKVCKARGFISGYTHALTVDAAATAIARGPFIVGSYWFDGMDSPTTEGIVTATGSIRGGHEYLCREYDADRDLWWFDNSWGTSWGLSGRFAYDSNTFDALLHRQGDVTAFVPISQPAPTPTPTPVPGGADVTDRSLAIALPPGWATGRHTGDNAKAAHAVAYWLQAKGLS